MSPTGTSGSSLDANPYLVDSAAVAASPIGAELESFGWRPVFPPTPYGPLVTHLETGIVQLAGGDVRLAMLLFKLVAVAAGLAVAALIRWVVGQVRPQDRDLATVAYLWNPAVLVEVAGEGHNDALMAVLVVLALGLTLRRRVALAVAAMVGAALTKYLPLLLVPLQLGYWWRAPERTRPLAGRVAAGAVTGLVVAVVLFAPFWRGSATFAGLRESGRAGHTGSTQTVVAEVLSRLVGEAAALRAVSVAAAAALVLLAVVLALRVPDGDALLRRCAVVMVARAGPGRAGVLALVRAPARRPARPGAARELAGRAGRPVAGVAAGGAAELAVRGRAAGPVRVPAADLAGGGGAAAGGVAGVVRWADFRELRPLGGRRRYRAPDRDAAGG